MANADHQDAERGRNESGAATGTARAKWLHDKLTRVCVGGGRVEGGSGL